MSDNKQVKATAKKEKNKFVSPEVEIIIFATRDMLTESGGLNFQIIGFGEEYEW